MKRPLKSLGIVKERMLRVGSDTGSKFASQVGSGTGCKPQRKMVSGSEIVSDPQHCFVV
jgi:hypothetical protein